MVAITTRQYLQWMAVLLVIVASTKASEQTTHFAQRICEHPPKSAIIEGGKGELHVNPKDDEEPITCTIKYKLKTENAEEAKALCTAVMPMRVAAFEQGEKTKCVFAVDYVCTDLNDVPIGSRCYKMHKMEMETNGQKVEQNQLDPDQVCIAKTNHRVKAAVIDTEYNAKWISLLFKHEHMMAIVHKSTSIWKMQRKDDGEKNRIMNSPRIALLFVNSVLGKAGSIIPVKNGSIADMVLCSTPAEQLRASAKRYCTDMKDLLGLPAHYKGGTCFMRSINRYSPKRSDKTKPLSVAHYHQGCKAIGRAAPWANENGIKATLEYWKTVKTDRDNVDHTFWAPGFFDNSVKGTGSDPDDIKLADYTKRSRHGCPHAVCKDEVNLRRTQTYFGLFEDDNQRSSFVETAWSTGYPSYPAGIDLAPDGLSLGDSKATGGYFQNAPLYVRKPIVCAQSAAGTTFNVKTCTKGERYVKNDGTTICIDLVDTKNADGSKKWLSWEHSEKECHDSGGKLASIESSKQNSFMHAMILSSQRNRLSNCNASPLAWVSAWFGVRRHTRAEMDNKAHEFDSLKSVIDYKTKENLYYSNFFTKYPDGGNEDCCELVANPCHYSYGGTDLDKLWNDNACDTASKDGPQGWPHQIGYFCQYDAV